MEIAVEVMALGDVVPVRILRELSHPVQVVRKIQMYWNLSKDDGDREGWWMLPTLRSCIVTYSRDIDKSYSWQKLYPLILPHDLHIFRVSGSSPRCFSPPKKSWNFKSQKSNSHQIWAPWPREFGGVFFNGWWSRWKTPIRYLKVLGFSTRKRSVSLFLTLPQKTQDGKPLNVVKCLFAGWQPKKAALKKGLWLGTSKSDGLGDYVVLTFVSSEWKWMEHAENPFFSLHFTQCEFPKLCQDCITGCPASTCFI